MLFLALVLRMDIGTGSCVVVGGFAPGGLNVNNNNFDNDNIAVVGLWKFCYFSPLSLEKLSGERTLSSRQPSFQSPESPLESQDIADCQ